MTDNEIIKALECCTGGGLCCECPMWEMLSANCIVELNRSALELIKRQQAELGSCHEMIMKITDDDIFMRINLEE